MLPWRNRKVVSGQSGLLRKISFPVFFLTSLALLARAQESEAPAQKSNDYAEEPYVFEQIRVHVRLENDGTGQQETYSRIRVQNEIGIRAFGQLIFGYNAANDRPEIKFVRVHRRHESVISVGSDAVQDLTSPITQIAPIYTDLRQKHITVPGLSPGDVLEYAFSTQTFAPLAPGQFWFQWNFVSDAIVLDEQLEVSLPRDRAIKLKTRPGSEPTVRDEGDRRVYHWRSSYKVRQKEGAAQRIESEPPPPAVQLTSFLSWQEVGRWYAALEREHRVLTLELRAKAAELVRGKTTDIGKVEALYDYVSMNLRYVSLSFGIGRYQPHSATEVLANKYGDCKDKAVLLNGLLEAVGLHGYPVLINSTRKIDPDVPSPAQFNHVINLVPLRDAMLWLDTTTEVAPFRVLLPSLRKKMALVISQDGNASLEQTPEHLPFPAVQTLDVEGQVDALGKLDAHVVFETRSDAELELRAGFRRSTPQQWTEMIKAIAEQRGNYGRAAVSDFKVSDPANTKEPFRAEGRLSLSGYLNRSKKQSQLDLPAIGLEPPDIGGEGSSDDVTLQFGPPIEKVQRLKLTVPELVALRAPIPVHIERDYADYSSTYRVDGHTLTAEWRLLMRKSEIIGARRHDYAAFRRAVLADQAQKILVENSVVSAVEPPAEASAEELHDEGLEAFKNHNYPAAVEFFEKAVAKDPKHRYAWNNLGRAYLVLGKLDKAIEALRKQIEVNPYDEYAYNNLGRALRALDKYDEAAQAFQKQIEINPLDQYAHGNLGALYVDMKKYDQAVKELETAVSITPDNAELYLTQGGAYLYVNQPDQAMQSFDRAVELAPGPPTWNNVAYELAAHRVHLDRAQQYAESAVSSVAAQLHNISVDHLSQGDVFLGSMMAAFWDTLGWVKFQRGDLEGAEKYLRAAWDLSETTVIADHLAQTYEKQGRKTEAIRTYEQALASSRTVMQFLVRAPGAKPPEEAPPPPTQPFPETRKRLSALLGSDTGIDARVNAARSQLSSRRAIKFRNPRNVQGSADFWVVLTPGPKLETVKFISGKEDLRDYGDQLRVVPSLQSFPDAAETKLLRRGVLSCSQLTHECTFVLTPAEDVHSLK